jgi:hypothetical protein
MSAPSGYQPFAITNFQTGQFQYTQPWMQPDDAWNPLVNSYVFRGQVQKRNGISVYGLTGSIRYQDNEIVATGNGGSTYSGILSNFPIEGTITFTALTSTGLKTATATATGNLSGSLAAAGSAIDYSTGVWNLNTTATIPALNPIVAQYTYTPNALTTPQKRPIMMITEFINEQTNAHRLVIADTRRFAVFNTITQLFDPVSSISQINYTTTLTSPPPPFTGPFTLTTGFTNLAPYSVIVKKETLLNTFTIEDDGTGGFTHSGNPLPDGTNIASASVNYATGVITINLVAPEVATFTVSSSLQGDYFTGDFKNLFNYVNWRASESDTSHLYMTNNVDQVTTYDGTNLARPPLGITLAHVEAFVNDIKTTLDVKVYNESLLLIRPTTVGNSFPDGQMIRSSAPHNPTNFAADVPGNGSFISASTGDWIMSASYLRDALVIEFEDSCFLFRSTGNVSSPFRFFKINSTKSTNAPYGSIEYDTYTTSMGAKGLCKCDGVNKDRYDVPDAIDLYTDIDENSFAICQGKRFDQTQQSWMIYPSDERATTNTNCDKVIVFNWLEETWSTYDISLSCIGSAKTYTDVTWNDLAAAFTTWEACTFTWNSLIDQDLVPWMLGGDTNGIVYYLNDAKAEMDKVIDTTDPSSGQLIDSTMVSKRWNPFIQQGQKATFGYVDFYYQVGRNSYTVDNDNGEQIVLQLSWYINNSNNPALIQSMTLDSPATGSIYQDYAWKRMYVNLTGQFLRLQIDSSSFINQRGQFVIAGMVLWAEPAGRLTPGMFL